MSFKKAKGMDQFIDACSEVLIGFKNCDRARGKCILASRAVVEAGKQLGFNIELWSSYVKGDLGDGNHDYPVVDGKWAYDFAANQFFHNARFPKVLDIGSEEFNEKYSDDLKKNPGYSKPDDEILSLANKIIEVYKKEKLSKFSTVVEELASSLLSLGEMRTKDLKINGKTITAVLMAGGSGFKIYSVGEDFIISVGRKNIVVSKVDQNRKTVMQYVNLRYQPISQQQEIKDRFNELIQRLQGTGMIEAKDFGHTAAKLKETLYDIEWFKAFTPGDWAEFGSIMKRLGANSAVFSGVIHGFFKYHAVGFSFPATKEYVKSKKVISTDRYSSDMVLDILEGANVLEIFNLPGAEILRGVFHTENEKDDYSNQPRKQFPVYFYNEDFVDEMRSFVAKHKIPLKLESRIILKSRIGKFLGERSDGYDSYAEVYQDLDARQVDLRPGVDEAVMIGEFKRQCFDTSFGKGGIKAEDFWGALAKQVPTVTDCVKILSSALDEGLPGLGEVFQVRAIELANENKWGGSNV